MKKNLLLIIIYLSSIQFLNGQSFSKGSSIGNINFINGASSWGDYDNDGDLDLILIGTPSNVSQSKLYSNNGDGTFTEIMDLNIINVGNGDVEWDDYDRDGNIDLLISGIDESGTKMTKLYQNNGDKTFTEVEIELVGLNDSSVSLIDFNNDAKLDLLVSGQGESTNEIRLFKSLDGDQFEEVEVPFEALSQSDIEWADFDNDGDIDVALAGYTGSSGLTKIYRNMGDETFEFHQQLTTAMRASIDWGDYNNDSQLDLVVSGFSGSEQTLIVYKNENGSFSKITDTDFVGGEQGNSLWIDYDNDGNLDIISSVIGDGVWATRLYHNDGNDAFSLDSNSGLPSDFSNISLIDIDQDGDLDVFFPSTFNSDNETAFYINESSTGNVSPSIPALHDELVEEASVTLSWQTTTDPQTSEVVSYNLFVTHEGDTVVSPNSLFTGKRKLAKSGNAQFQLAYTLSKKAPGDYTYSIQAIDNSFNASAFAPVKSFYINYPPVITGITTSLTSSEGTPVTININDLIVEDPDNVFPDDFSLTVLNGENYTVSNNEISPDIGYGGILSVPVSVNDGTDESEQFIIEVEATKILGTSKDHFDPNLSIYPNPVFNHLNIDLNGKFNPNQLRIYNISGTLIYSSIIEGNNDKFQLDLSLLEKGTYTLKLTNNRQMANFILIKE